MWTCKPSEYGEEVDKLGLTILPSNVIRIFHYFMNYTSSHGWKISFNKQYLWAPTHPLSQYARCFLHGDKAASV